ncbi:uncharacterized protein CLAFUR5_02455 [Fulvia fulva]|uniref:Uncharacterized protein n=1 Tax=Passalora fulva TaxID=5499 RepID=A0A9Q8LAJ8_PASFU|nr:uncharacterized protein CLAFUR5_02455 [Fulvia fulva]UJO13719.1 hypothetical protein CLAFUR5_02455 [Fulvia fulva]
MPSARQIQKLSDDIPGLDIYLRDFANTVPADDVEALLQEKVVIGVLTQLKNEEWQNNLRYANLAAILIKKMGEDPDVDEGTMEEQQLKRWAVKTRRILSKVRVPGSTSGDDLYSITTLYNHPVKGYWAKKLGGRQLSKWDAQVVAPAAPRARRGAPGGGRKQSAKRKNLFRAMGGTPPGYGQPGERPAQELRAAPNLAPAASTADTTMPPAITGANVAGAGQSAAPRAVGDPDGKS